MKTKNIICWIIIISIFLFFIYFKLLIFLFTEINFVLTNIINIWNSNLMMDNVGSAPQNISNIGSSVGDVASSSDTKISIKDKPQNVPLFKDLLTRSVPIDFVATLAHYDHLYETVYTTYETIKSEYPADKLTSKLLNMELIWRERFKLLVVTYDGDPDKIDQDLSADIYTLREMCKQTPEFSSKLGAGTRWTNLSLGKSSSKILDELWQRTSRFNEVVSKSNEDNN
jgi:hypothetical protein